MNKPENKDSRKLFAALKLIEQLYKDGLISEDCYKEIIRENAPAEKIGCFYGFFESAKKRKEE